MTLHLSILLWLPARGRRRSALLAPPRAARWLALAGLGCSRSAYAIVAASSTSTAGGGLQYVTDETWIAELGHPLQARRRRAEPLPRRC